MKSISRRQFIKQAAAGGSAVALGGLAGLSTTSCGQASHPNLLFVFPDQMRGQALGFMNEDPVLTPNLDRFSRESVTFTHAVSNYPICSPYRGMLMTGRYPHSTGMLANCNSRSAEYGIELRESERCWSDVLNEKGYSLGYIGKWHMDAPRKPYVDCYNNRGEVAWNEWCPPNRRHGFDFWYAYGTYDRHMRPMYWRGDAGRDEAHWVDQWGPEHEADLAIDYIRNKNGTYRDAAQPFALVVSMNPPHMPYDQLPMEYVDMYRDRSLDDLCSRPNIPSAGTQWGDYYRKHIRNYLAMTTGVDAQFGRILEALKENGLDENTIVVFTSDHGNCLGIHDEISKNNPYEESLRIPLMIRWPGRIKPRHDDLLISVPDMYPTLLDLMSFGGDIPKKVDGRSHASLLRTGEGDRPTSQLIMKVPLGQPGWGMRGVRTHQHTLVVHRMPGLPAETVLYDRDTDPYQLRNAADKYPEVVKELIEKELYPWLDNWNHL